MRTSAAQPPVARSEADAPPGAGRGGQAVRLDTASLPPVDAPACEDPAMKIRNSLKSAKTRDKNCVLVRRKGRLYVLNKKNPRLKARQG